MFSRVGAIDRCSHVSDDENGWLFSGRLLRVRPNRLLVDSRFLAVYLSSEFSRQWIRNHAVGSTMPCLNTSILKEVPVSVPPISTQKRIAEILGAVDEAIRSTERIIAKLEQVKQGLLHDLLTRGIDGSGRLRNSERQPDLFVRTPLGLLPKAWEISAIGAVADVFNGSTPSRLRHDYWTDGKVPWLASGKVNDYEINSPSELVTDRAVKECSLRVLPAGAVVVGMIGEGKTRGMAARLDIAAAINQNLAGIIPGDRVDGRFLHLFLSYYYEALRRGGRGSNQDALNTQLVYSFQIAIPSLREQRSIGIRVDSAARRVNAERREVGKLRALKQGLMDDLLTARVKVGVSR